MYVGRQIPQSVLIIIVNGNPLINKHDKNPSNGIPYRIFHFQSLTK
jgi:hypothetical protein